MKLVIVSALFTAAMSLFAASSSSAPSPAAIQAIAPDDDAAANPVGSECEVAGGTCRKSVCRSGETSVPLTCGHDLGCCLAR